MTRGDARRLVVAIDGPAGAGKSTLARALAFELGVPYVNTGLMYRAVAAEALRAGADPDDAEALSEIARSLRFSLDEREPPSMLVGGEPPPPELAGAEVERIVSRVSSHPTVRDVLRGAQRRLGEAGAVVEGRDIGTVVFPDAGLKIFLRAESAERASRRQAERGSDDAALANALERRDAADARTNPLVPAADAHVVDTTGRQPKDVLMAVLDLLPERPR